MRRWRLFLVLRVYARLLRKWRSSVEPLSSRRSPLLDPKSRHRCESGLLRCGARSPGRRTGHGFRRSYWLWSSADPRVLDRSQKYGEGFREFHIAFVAPDRPRVREFFDAALARGAEVLHEPRLWPEYHANYLAPLYVTRMAIMSRRSATRRSSGMSDTVRQFGAVATPLGPTVITRPWPWFATPLGPTATSRAPQLSDFRLAHFVSIISSPARSRRWRASAVCLRPPERRCPCSGDGEKSRFLLLP